MLGHCFEVPAEAQQGEDAHGARGKGQAFDLSGWVSGFVRPVERPVVLKDFEDIQSLRYKSYSFS